MLNIIWIAMVVGAVVFGALNGTLNEVSKASVDTAKSAVDLAIGLVGVMALWLGLMRVLQQSGLLAKISRAMRPLMVRLFPDVPADHPAMSMMILNMTSNMFGLANAATPFGLKAMLELDKLNRNKGVATDAMALFLAINTSNLALLPTGMIALRASLGSDVPGSILVPTILATACSTVVAVGVAKFLAARWYFRRQLETIGADGLAVSAAALAESEESGVGQGSGHASDAMIDTREAEAALAVKATPLTGGPCVVLWMGIAAVLLAFLVAIYGLATGSAGVGAAGQALGWGGALRTVVSEWALVLLLISIVLYGALRGVKVYDAVVDGGKEGFQVALKIIPFLVAILVAVGMLRASGAIDGLVSILDPFTRLIGMPAEALPMALLRSLSGSGAYGVASEIMVTHGPDTLVGNIVSTMQGSTETTFYVLALYFGVVQVRNGRHTVLACLAADAVGALAAVWACRLLLG